MEHRSVKQKACACTSQACNFVRLSLKGTMLLSLIQVEQVENEQKGNNLKYFNTIICWLTTSDRLIDFFLFCCISSDAW